RIPQYLWVCQHHAAKSYQIRPAIPYCSLRHVRQKILKIAVCGSHENQVWKLLFQLSRDVHVQRYSMQRIFRGLISIRWRIERWALNVWIVVRAASGDIHQPDLQLLQQTQETNRFGEIHLRGVVRAHAESPAV